LTHARSHLINLAAELKIPVENLITPEFVRRVCWQEPPKSESGYQEFIISELNKFGARDWQIGQVLAPLKNAIGQTEPIVIAEAQEDEPALESEQ